MMTNTNSSPLLTIAVPSYNVERYLEKGLSTYNEARLEGRLQVVVVNDGSTDSTPAIAQRFCAARPAVFELITKENGGHGSAINAGIQAARGKYFRVIDGDDWVDTENLFALLEHLAGSDDDLVIDVRQDVDMTTGTPHLCPLPKGVPLGASLPFDKVCECEELLPRIMIHSLNIRTDYVRKSGLQLLEKTFYVDFEYVVKATLQAQSIRFLDINVYQYLVGNASQSVADDNYVKRWEDHTRVTEEMLRLYEDMRGTLEPSREKYLFNRCVLLCNTHYNIALIFDKDRKRGARRAKEFQAYLRERHPAIAGATKRRYLQARALHYTGIDSQEKLNRLVH